MSLGPTSADVPFPCMKRYDQVVVSHFTVFWFRHGGHHLCLTHFRRAPLLEVSRAPSPYAATAGAIRCVPHNMPNTTAFSWGAAARLGGHSLSCPSLQRSDASSHPHSVTAATTPTTSAISHHLHRRMYPPLRTQVMVSERPPPFLPSSHAASRP